jgi:transcriptional regulator with XRE-family HTH domain
MTFWERFYNLCIEKETKPNPVCKELGFSNSASTHWKSGQLPGATSLKKIADYFEVTVDYLLGKTDIKKEPTAQNEQPVSEELQKLINASSSLSDEEATKVLEFVEFIKSQRN